MLPTASVPAAWGVRTARSSQPAHWGDAFLPPSKMQAQRFCRREPDRSRHAWPPCAAHGWTFSPALQSAANIGCATAGCKITASRSANGCTSGAACCATVFMFWICWCRRAAFSKSNACRRCIPLLFQPHHRPRTARSEVFAHLFRLCGVSLIAAALETRRQAHLHFRVDAARKCRVRMQVLPCTGAIQKNSTNRQDIVPPPRAIETARRLSPGRAGSRDW